MRATSLTTLCALALCSSVASAQGTPVETSPRVRLSLASAAALQTEPDESMSTAGAALVGGLIGAYTGAVVAAIATLDCGKYCPIFGAIGGAVGVVVGIALLADHGADSTLMPQPARIPVVRYAIPF